MPCPGSGFAYCVGNAKLENDRVGDVSKPCRIWGSLGKADTAPIALGARQLYETVGQGIREQCFDTRKQVVVLFPGSVDVPDEEHLASTGGSGARGSVDENEADGVEVGVSEVLIEKARGT
ncbi:hypothetical protein B0H10DRAFT_1962766 [Mycena sp. CBHHK59/15]|nr:hypothetical protein B0H10DRAFT_1962766 [Mycena sp. CBHHK59/15]